MGTVTAFYRFVSIDDLTTMRTRLRTLLSEWDIWGTILIAHEGINSTVWGEDEDVLGFKAALTAMPEFTKVTFKDSPSNERPFRRQLVKIKREIIRMNQPEIDPNLGTGTYLDADGLLALLQRDDVLLVDTRNDYEVAAGTFRGALNPKIQSFSEFPGWVKNHLESEKERPVVTFCTGGIRCEKATSYMQAQGFKEVYQIEGGILKFLEDFAKKQTDGDATRKNPWEGECIVFDKRKAVGIDLAPTKHEFCYVCLCELHSKNRASDRQFLGGTACIECADTMDANSARRREEGELVAQAHRERRKTHCAAERAKHMAE